MLLLTLGILAHAGGSWGADDQNRVVSASELATLVAPSGKARIMPLARGKEAFVGLLTIDPGVAVPLHRDESEEYLIVIEGGGLVVIDGTSSRIARGDAIYMPAGAEVEFKNGSNPTVVFQVFAGPESSEKYASWRDPTAVPVTPTTTGAALRAAYGDASLVRSPIGVGEGMCIDGVVLFPDTEKEVRFVWSDPVAETGPTSVEWTGGPWRVSGIGIGTPIAEVEKRNGKPFFVGGLEWDYGGYADWSDGALEGRVSARFKAARSGPDAMYGPQNTFRSDDPRALGMGLTVDRLYLAYPAQEGAPQPVADDCGSF